MPISNYLENKILDFLLRGQSFIPPSSLYVTLCSGSPVDSSTGSNLLEMSGGGFVRKEVPSSTSGWYSTQGDTSAQSTGTSGIASNLNSILWQNSGWSGIVTHVAICDSGSAGNLLFYGELSYPKQVASGDNILFNQGKLAIQLD